MFQYLAPCTYVFLAADNDEIAFTDGSEIGCPNPMNDGVGGWNQCTLGQSTVLSFSVERLFLWVEF